MNKKRKLIVIASLMGMLTLFSVNLFVSYSEEKNWLDYIRDKCYSLKSILVIQDVDIISNNQNRQIIVTVAWNDKNDISIFEKANAVVNIRNVVQTYIINGGSRIINEQNKIELRIRTHLEPPTASNFIVFTNQYDDIYHPVFPIQNVNSCKLDTVLDYSATFSEDELELFSDSKSMILDVSKVSDFSFLKKFVKLKYLSIRNFQNEQIDECIKYLPDSCELYIGDITFFDFIIIGGLSMRKIKFSKIIIFVILGIMILGILFFVFLYNPFSEYEKVAVDYVASNYGKNYKVISVTPDYSSPMPFRKHLNYVTFTFSDDSNQPNFNISVDWDLHDDTIKVIYDGYYRDRYEALYRNRANEYAKTYDFNKEYKFEIGLSGHFDHLYNDYNEMVSDKDELKSWKVSICLTVYGNNDPEKYKWVYDFYQELKKTQYRKMCFVLFINGHEDGLQDSWLYSNMDVSYSEYISEDSERSIDHFFNT